MAEMMALCDAVTIADRGATDRDGYPIVRRGSALFEYLEQCEPGCDICMDALDPPPVDPYLGVPASSLRWSVCK